MKPRRVKVRIAEPGSSLAMTTAERSTFILSEVRIIGRGVSPCWSWSASMRREILSSINTLSSG